jgi:hypothetical protein
MSEPSEGGGDSGVKRERGQETPAQKVQRLERELQQARIDAKEAHQRACAIVGQAALDEAQDDGEFKARLGHILRRRVKGNAPKSAIAGVLLEMADAGAVQGTTAQASKDDAAK